MSSDDIAIRVSNLSKRYEIYNKPGDRLKQFIIPKLCRILPVLKRFSSIRTDSNSDPVFFNEFWALKDVSFEIKKGETVGIIGRNGAGKSTLLQLICGTLNPTAGEIKVNGRIAALLELGAGFNPEFTGRENVQMSCALLGMTPEETEAHFEEIAAFADIGEFIEQPVKTYSSGMFVRLAFAVNIVSKPDIMIVDEALAVGDMAFQTKCMTALNHIQKKGLTILFVTHDVDAVRNLCSHAVYLDQGKKYAAGFAPDIVDLYLRKMREEINKDNKTNSEIPQITNSSSLNASDVSFKTSTEFDTRVSLFRHGSGEAKINYVEMLDENGKELSDLKFDQEVLIKIYFTSHKNTKITPGYYIRDAKKN
jgi:ABC-type polysaccharide/polyol phosphate transport system, ATPase component